MKGEGHGTLASRQAGLKKTKQHWPDPHTLRTGANMLTVMIFDRPLLGEQLLQYIYTETTDHY